MADKFLAANIEYLILDRTAFNKNGRDLLTIQKVPEEIYDASYPAWFFSEENIINKILKKYELIAGFSSPFENDISISEELNVYWKGYFFKLK